MSPLFILCKYAEAAVQWRTNLPRARRATVQNQLERFDIAVRWEKELTLAKEFITEAVQICPVRV